MEDLLHKKIRVEQQLKRKGVAKRSSTNYGSSSWKDKSKGAATSNEFQEQSSKKSQDVKCFRCQGLGHYAYECPNKKAMILRDG